MKWENIKEISNEYEMRDSSGYNIPNTPEALNMIYSLRAKNELSSQRIEGLYSRHLSLYKQTRTHSFYTLIMELE